MHESVHKRLIFATKVIYIDDGFLFKKSIEQRQEIINQISKQTDSLGFKFFVTSLAQVLITKDPELFNLENYKCFNDNDEKKLMEIYDKLSDETSRKDFLHKIREKLFVKVARYLDCGKIFLDEDSTSLAITVMSNVSLGRGAQLSSDVGFVDDRHEGVMILRPMRDFTRLELQYLMDINKLESFNMEKSQVNPYTSIQGLTEQFVIDLDSQFGGTVATIFRTGEKLSSKSKNSKADEARCVMCDGNLDTNCLESSTSAIEATNFSRLVSTKGSLAEHDLDVIDASDEGKTNGCGNCSGNCQTKNNTPELSFNDAWKYLCYACRRIFNDQRNFDDYFLTFLKATRERIVLDNMRDEIKDFLL